MRVETALAKAAMGLVERREPKNVHHKMTLAEFAEADAVVRLDGVSRRRRRPPVRVAGRDGSGLLQGAGAALQVRSPRRLEGLSALDRLARARLGGPEGVRRRGLRILRKRLGGQAEIKARWKRCVAATDEQLGEALGEAYVEREFSPEAKQRVLAMMRQIEEAMEARIKTLDWMSESDEGARAREARERGPQGRLPGQVARLLEARDCSRRCAGQHGARVRLRAAPPARQDRQARRPRRVEHDAAD